MMRSVWIMLIMLVTLAPVQALDPGEALADPMLETRARALSQELRCMVCQNQSIDDSDAPLAKRFAGVCARALASG
jgi:cytochrome c-type biogenesis protein CcmH